MIVREIRRHQQQRLVIEDGPDGVGNPNRVNVTSEEWNHGYPRGNHLEERKLHLERVFAFVSSRRLGDQRANGYLGGRRRIDRNRTKWCLEQIVAGESQTREPHVVGRTEHDDPANVIHRFEQLVAGRRDRTGVHVARMGHDQDPDPEVQVDRLGVGKVAPDIGLEPDGICRIERASDGRLADGRAHGAPLEAASTVCRSGGSVHGLPALHGWAVFGYVDGVTTEEDPYVAVARSAIRHYLATGEISAPPSMPDDPPPSGVFVSLHEPASPGHAEGPLRGCIGTIRPREQSVRSEIARSAVSAAVSDPRFPPLQPGEVDGLEVTVYLLDAPEPIDDADQLDPARYGVIVEGPGGRSGLLLPAIPGITTAEQQVDIATRKAGLSPADPVRLSRFSARIIH